MTSTKFAVSFDPNLADQVRRDARASGKSVSGWLADAAEQELRNRHLAAYIADYEREFGEITDEDMREVDELWPELFSTPEVSSRSKKATGARTRSSNVGSRRASA
jgi:hypothetical protein